MAAAQSCHSQRGQSLSVWAQISRVQHWKNDLHYHGLCHALLLHQGLVHTEQLVSCSIFMASVCARNAHVACRYTEIGMRKVLLNWGTARGGQLYRAAEGPGRCPGRQRAGWLLVAAKAAGSAQTGKAKRLGSRSYRRSAARTGVHSWRPVPGQECCWRLLAERL